MYHCRTIFLIPSILHYYHFLDQVHTVIQDLLSHRNIMADPSAHKGHNCRSGKKKLRTIFTGALQGVRAGYHDL